MSVVIEMLPHLKSGCQPEEKILQMLKRAEIFVCAESGFWISGPCMQWAQAGRGGYRGVQLVRVFIENCRQLELKAFLMSRY